MSQLFLLKHLTCSFAGADDFSEIYQKTTVLSLRYVLARVTRQVSPPVRFCGVRAAQSCVFYVVS